MSGISLSVVLWEFCLRQEWVDLRFVASDGIVWAQRAVLAARCANWKSLLLDQVRISFRYQVNSP